MKNELTITIKFNDIEKTMTTVVPEYTKTDLNPNPTPLDKSVNNQIDGIVTVLRQRIMEAIR